jgi:hypothetical protein
MRLRITQRLSGSVDGLPLSQFELGESYDVGTSMGSYLLAVGAAEPVPVPDPAPADDARAFPSAETRRLRSALLGLTHAADSSRPSTAAPGAPGKVGGRMR